MMRLKKKINLKKNRCQLVLACKTRGPCHLIISTKYEKTTNHNFQYIKY
jgi:hypothetical protein